MKLPKKDKKRGYYSIKVLMWVNKNPVLGRYNFRLKKWVGDNQVLYKKIDKWEYL